MNDPIQEQNMSFSNQADPYAAKANMEIKQQELRERGYSSLWREISNLLILIAVIGGIILISRIF
ncbi:hypothetical protein M3231_08510 [Neobacillus mesonae]|nr:hypothetical protein [Neobacillus mesonae]